MRFNIFTNKTSNLFAENRLLKFAVVVMIAGNVVTGMVVYAAVQYKTVVLIPSDLREEVVIQNGIPDDRYIEKVVDDVSHLALTYSPATARQQFDRLLEYVAPEVFPEISKRWYNLASQIESTQVSSVFYLENIHINPKSKVITVKGRRRQFVEDQVVENSNKIYQVSYDIRRGRLFIIGIHEKSSRS